MFPKMHSILQKSRHSVIVKSLNLKQIINGFFISILFFILNTFSFKFDKYVYFVTLCDEINYL